MKQKITEKTKLEILAEKIDRDLKAMNSPEQRKIHDDAMKSLAWLTEHLDSRGPIVENLELENKELKIRLAEAKLLLKITFDDKTPVCCTCGYADDCEYSNA